MIINMGMNVYVSKGRNIDLSEFLHGEYSVTISVLMRSYKYLLVRCSWEPG